MKTVFEYIENEKTAWKTTRVPLTGSKDWNMSEHIERCTNVANAWFHTGNNDGIRPYDDIVTPIINVAFRSEGFDVKDIVPFVNDAVNYYKSFIIKKYHPQWARKNQIDTFIDDVVETSIIYDLVLVKDINNTRPEVVDLKTIAFCDQTDIMAGPICLEHQYTVAELLSYKGKWNDEAIDLAISLASEEKTNPIANDQTTKTPSKYIKCYELRGLLPERWFDDTANEDSYINQMQIVCLYTDSEGNKQGITLYSGKDKPLSESFKALKIDRIRSKGRACGRSLVESLFEPQVWNNYSAIKLKKLLDSAITVFQTDSDEIANQKLSEIKDNTILKHEQGKPLTKVDGSLQNLAAFQSYQNKQEQSARTLGSASDPALGLNPVSGTPLGTVQNVIQQGQGIHEYRQGKIATFFADVLYPELILGYMVKDINNGVEFSEELTLDELSQIADSISNNTVESKIKKQILETGKVPTNEERDQMIALFKEEFMKGGKRKFFKTLQKELKDIPIAVMVNIKGKQRYMAQNADKITNIITTILKNPEGFAQTPGLGKAFNELLEESGMSAINFNEISSAKPSQPLQTQAVTAG